MQLELSSNIKPCVRYYNIQTIDVLYKMIERKSSGKIPKRCLANF